MIKAKKLLIGLMTIATAFVVASAISSDPATALANAGSIYNFAACGQGQTTLVNESNSSRTISNGKVVLATAPGNIINFAAAGAVVNTVAVMPKKMTGGGWKRLEVRVGPVAGGQLVQNARVTVYFDNQPTSFFLYDYPDYLVQHPDGWVSFVITSDKFNVNTDKQITSVLVTINNGSRGSPIERSIKIGKITIENVKQKVNSGGLIMKITDVCSQFFG